MNTISESGYSSTTFPMALVPGPGRRRISTAEYILVHGYSNNDSIYAEMGKYKEEFTVKARPEEEEST
jgi:hypothetical protein